MNILQCYNNVQMQGKEVLHLLGRAAQTKSPLVIEENTPPVRFCVSKKSSTASTKSGYFLQQHLIQKMIAQNFIVPFQNAQISEFHHHDTIGHDFTGAGIDRKRNRHCAASFRM